MSKVIDDYAVRMEFDNSRFERNVQTSLGTIERLKQSVNFNSQSDSLREFERIANQFDLTKMEQSLRSVERRFTTLGIIGMRVIQNLTDSTMRAVSRVAYTVNDAIVTRGINRAMNVENAHFMLQGLLHDEEKVQQVMQEAKDSVDGTAYAFDTAAKAASMFTSSGIQAGDDLQLAMKSLADVTAATNSNYEDMAMIFTQISGKGRLMGDELLQLSSRGMNASALLAKYFREVRGEAGMTEAQIRDMTSKGKIDFKTFAEAMEYSFEGHAKKANETFQGVTANIRAALAKIGEGFITLEDASDGFNESLIKQNGPLVKLLNTVRDRINDLKDNIKPLQKDFITFAKDGSKYLNRWLKNVDVSPLIKLINGFGRGIINFVRDIGSFLAPIGDAFRIVFSSSVVSKLADFATGFKRMTAELQLSEEDAGKLRDTFTDVFRIMGFVKEAVDSVLKSFSPMESFGTSIFKIFNRSVRTLINLVDGLKSVLAPISQAFNDVFSSGIAIGLRIVVKAFKRFSETLRLSDEDSRHLYDTFTGIFSLFKIFGNVVATVVKAFSPLMPIIGGVLSVILAITGAIGRFITSLANVGKKAEMTFQSSSKAVSDFSGNVKSGFSFIESIQKRIDALTSSLFNFGKSTNNASKGTKDVGSNAKSSAKSVSFFGKIIDNFKRKVDALSTALFGNNKAMKQSKDGVNNTSKAYNTQTSIIVKFATAISKAGGMLLGFFKSIPGKLASLANSIGEGINNIFKTMTAKRFNQIIQSSALFTFVRSFKRISRNFMMTFGQLGSSTSMLIRKISTVFGSLSKALKALQRSIDAQTLKSLAVSIAILSGSLLVLSTIDGTRVATALAGMTGAMIDLMAGMAILAKISGTKGVTIVTKGLITLSVAVFILASAVKQLSHVDPVQMAASVAAIGILMLELVGISALISKTGTEMIKGSFGLIMFAIALDIMADVVSKLSAIDPRQMVYGLLGLAAVLLELAGFSNLVDDKKFLLAGLAMTGMATGLLVMAKVINKLSSIDPRQMVYALLGLCGVLLELAMFTNLVDAKKLLLASLAMTGIATGLLVMSEVINRLASIDPKQMAFALLGMAGALIELYAFTELIDVKKFLLASLAMTGISTGLLVMAEAIKTLSSIDPRQMASALLGMAGALIELYAFTELVSPVKMLATGIALNVVASGLVTIAEALVSIGALSFTSIISGLAGIGILLLEIGIFAKQMSVQDLFSIGPAIQGIGQGLKVIAEVIATLGALSFPEIIKGLIAVGGALLVLAVAGKAMNASLAGAAAMVVMAFAIRVLTPALEALGKLSLGQLVIALLGLAGVFAVIGVAGLLLAPVIPLILGLSAAMLLMGAGMAAFGVGLTLIVAGLTALKLKSIAFRSDFAMLLKMIGMLITEFVKSIITALALVGEALVKVFIKIAKYLGSKAKVLVDAGIKIVKELLRGVRKTAPDVTKTGTKVTVSFLDGLGKKMGKIVDKGTMCITEFLNGLAKNADQIVEAGTNLVVSLGKAIMKQGKRAASAGTKIGKSALSGIKKTLKGWAEAGKNAVLGFIKGLGQIPGKLISAASNLGKAALQAAKDSLGVSSPSKEFMKVGAYSLEGLCEGFKKNTNDAKKIAQKSMHDILYAARDTLGIHSASKEFKKVGGYALEGLGDGVKSATKDVKKTVKKSMSGVLDTASNALSDSSIDKSAPNWAMLVGNKKSDDKKSNKKDVPYWAMLAGNKKKNNKAAKEAGKEQVESYSKGIQNGSGTASKTARSVGTSTAESLGSSESDNAAEEQGKKVDEKYAEGIKLNKSIVKRATEFVASLAVQGFDASGLAESMGKITSGSFVEGLRDALGTITPENAGNVKRFFDILIPKDVIQAAGANSANEMIGAFDNALKAKQPKNAKDGDKVDWGEKQLNEAMIALTNIFQQYEIEFDAFNSKLLENGKITAAYLSHSVQDQLLANAVRVLGNDVYEKLNKKVDKEYERLLKKHKKFQKKIELTDKEKTNLRNKAAKNVAQQAISEYTDEFKSLQDTLSKMTDQKTMKTIASVPSAVATYLKKYNKSFKSVKGVMKSFSKNFGSGASGAVKALGMQLYQQTDDYKNQQKELKKYAKQLQKIQTKAKLKEAIIFDPDASAKRKNRASQRLKELAQQERSIEKSLKKTAKAIAKGPAKAIEEFRDNVKETVKSFVSLSNVDFSKVVDGFNKVERSTNLIEDASATFDIFNVSLQKTSESAEQAADAMGLLNVNVESGMNLLERFTKVSSMSVRRLMKNATSQLKAYQEFQNGIAELRKRGLDSSMVDDLESQGTGALNYIRGFLKMSAKEITEYNKLVSQKTKYEANATGKAIEKQSEKYEQWTKNLEKLSGKIPEEMMKQLKENGVESSDYVEALLNMDSKQLAKVAKTYTQSASKVIKTATEETSEEGYKSFLEGVRALSEQYEKWNNDLATLSTRGLSDAVVAKMREMGVDSTKDYVESMLKETAAGIQEINQYFEKSQNQGRTSSQVWIENLNTTNKTYKQWQKDMKQVAADVGKDHPLYKGLQEMGWEAGAEYARAFVEASESEKETIIEQFDKQQTYNNNAILASMEGRVKKIQQWNDDLKKLAGRNGMTDAFMKELIEMGPEAADQVHAITEMSQGEFEKFAKAYSEAITSVPTVISEDVTAAYAKVAQDTINSYSQNVGSEESFEKLNKATKKTQDKTHKKAKKRGKKHGKETGKVIIEVLKSVLTAAVGDKVATNMVDGMVRGLEKGESPLASAARQLAQNTVDALKSALKINSPSKVFEEIGEYTGEGFVLGLTTYAGQVTDATDELAASAIENMTTVMGQIDDLTRNGQSIAPTIAPVLDTSALYSDILKLNTMLESFGDININIEKDRNKDIVDAIQSMDSRVGDKFSELSKTISDLQVVMDTGTLVGELTPHIDRKLYQRTALKQRGM